MSKQIYLIISQTGTMLSRILKRITGAEYNHASISLVSNLQTMYSFGRLHPYNPFWGGFVIESPLAGTFKRFSNTEAVILAIDVSDEQYHQIQETPNQMLTKPDTYHYNYLGLGLAAFRIHYHKPKHYYCSEFVKEILQLSEIQGAERLNPIVQPIHFLSLPQVHEIYRGKLKDFADSLSNLPIAG